ncbi:S8 family serine peptidase [Actinosynnema sp. NPDC020468]|uniref:S8 family serine peptidase n=1 Tax=Actinosynnema sp. NPDC020468 TaxID=3154488 RepID=UPI0033E10B8A
MKRHRVALLAAALVATLAASGVAGADDERPEPLAASTLPAPASGSSERIGTTLAAATGAVTAFVELATTPASQVFADEKAGGAGDAQAASSARESRADTGEVADKVVDVLRGKDAGTREVAKTANAVPGVVVTADAAKVRELAALPEVRSVRLAVPKSVQNASAVQLTRAARIWRQTGKTGQGLRVGIIDTGVDYTHADFGGTGTTEAFDAVDRSGPWTPTGKVVGGYDFSGDEYDALDPAHATPKPDPNPLDCQGHGTHVAGTAAGYGENADGSTFTGDHTTLTDAQLDTMRIGPGTAPGASLYALKVFGCKGSTNLSGQAMDWALDPDGDGDPSDHLDVVNMSLGTDYGGQDDPDGLFARKLVEHGVLVVASAGNGGDFYDVGGAPGNTPEVLAVANTRDAYALLDGANAEGIGDLPGQYGQNFTAYPALDLTRPVVTVADTANADGCAPITQDLKGSLVWLEWDEDDVTRKCGSAIRADHARDAGADGVLLSSTADVFSAAIAGNDAVPTFQFTATATAAVRPALEAGTLRVRLTGKLRNSVPTRNPTLADTLTPSSARGARGREAAKPDVAAPGDTIVSAGVGTGNGALSKGGTSMASPHVAGIGALVRQAHPGWTPEEVKAAIMNTAGAGVTSGDDHGTGQPEAPMRVGAGRVDAVDALGTDLLAMVTDSRGAVGVSFGPVEVARNALPHKAVRLVNKSSADREVTLRYEAATEVPGAVVDVTPAAVRVPAGGSAEVTVTLRLTGGDLRKVGDPTVERTQNGVARQFLAEVSGRVLVSSGATVLRVPVYAAPKPVSDLSAVLVGGKLRLRGEGLAQGSGPEAYRSLVSVFELQGESPRLPDCSDEVKTDCAVNTSAKGGDLRYVGVSSTAPVDEARPLLAFGIATWGDWYTLGVGNTPDVRIDTTGDGLPDFSVKAAKPTDPTGNVTADVWVAETVRLSDGAVVDQQPLNGQYGNVDTNVMDTDVVVLPVGVAALGLDPTAPSARISYTVGTTGSYPAPGNEGGYVDRIPGTFSFDVLRPGLSVRAAGAAALSFVGRSGVALDVVRDEEALALDGPSARFLVLQHHNASGSRAQVVTD